MFWENSPKHKGEGVKSLKRSMSIIRMARDIPDNEWDHSEQRRYGLGNGTCIDLHLIRNDILDFFIAVPQSVMSNYSINCF